MRSQIDATFELSLAIALRLVTQAPRMDYSTKNPGLRDKGAAAIARSVVEQLQLAGWKIELVSGPDDRIALPPRDD